ncbi:MAG: sugar isomerase [Spirochaetae bacterium HGW-Spirochaetae-4]|nr:MAG: sugar isomerase [Spirochaetae bacterium HGW-Spirochaetae-4]
MFNFQESVILEQQKNGVGIIEQTQKYVDEVLEGTVDSILFIGIGGTEFYANQMAAIVKESHSSMPLQVVNAADLCLIGYPSITENTLVVIESISGDTKELVDAVKYVKVAGAVVIGYVEKKDSPLAKLVDYLVCTTGGGYHFWYTVTLRLLNKRGDFHEYDSFMKEFKTIPKVIVSVYKQVDQKAEAFAEAYCDEPIHYLIGSGNLEDWAYCYAMCILEEMQWIRTRAVSASNFFHGTLEVIDRDTSVILIKGEDITRTQMDRVEKFVHTVCKKVTVFDTKEFVLEGISEKYRGILSPIVMRSAFMRVSIHLEEQRKHPLAIRRYYRRLDY